MDALGASTTRGYNTDCPTAWIDCPGNSWATGTNPAVNSVYLRLLALNPALEDNNANDAESGSRMADLPTQADSAVHRQVDLVLIAMGINDACGGPDREMSTVSSFAASFTRAMDRLTTGLPDARVMVSSIPDPYRIWQLFHDDPAAVKAWGAARLCPSLLTGATSTAAGDIARRAAVRQRVNAYNRVLAQSCERYAHCETDGGAALDAPLARHGVSRNDYWHPSIARQAQLAALAWAALGY